MLNNICLMGRMVYEPELKTTPNGTSVITFKIAVNRTYNREETDFINIVAWRNTAEFVAVHEQGFSCGRRGQFADTAV